MIIMLGAGMAVGGHGFVAIARGSGGLRGRQPLRDPLHRHDITDPAAQGQQGDHEGEQKHAHSFNDKGCYGKFPATAHA